MSTNFTVSDQTTTPLSSRSPARPSTAGPSVTPPPPDGSDIASRSVSLLCDEDSLAAEAVATCLRASLPDQLVRYERVPSHTSAGSPSAEGSLPAAPATANRGSTLVLWKPNEELLRSLHAGPFRYRIVLACRQRPSTTWIRSALRLSPTAAISCDDTLETLIAATQSAVRGRPYLSTTAERWFQMADGKLVPRNDQSRKQLTDRQAEVLRMFALGFSIKETAKALDLTEKTVESHRYRVCKRLGVHDRSELVRIAIQEGLVAS